MIPPSLLSVSGWFMALPVWRLEIVPEVAPPPQDEACSDAPADSPDTAQAGAGTSRWVFQGIEWRPGFNWECMSNPAWSQWVEAKDDADQERLRREARLRNVPSVPLPVAAPPGVAPLPPDGVPPARPAEG